MTGKYGGKKNITYSQLCFLQVLRSVQIIFRASGNLALAFSLALNLYDLLNVITCGKIDINHEDFYFHNKARSKGDSR